MKNIVLIVAFLMGALSFSQDNKEFFTKADAFFKKHVQNGRVDYKAIKKDPTSLDELLSIAATAKVSKNDPMTFQAFYINSYNLSVIKGVVAHYPTKSPLSIKGFFDKKLYTIAGEKTTVNNIENVILRKNFPKEARFHFALVCGGLGCPPIISAAYLPSTLDNQLETQTTIALNNPDFIKVKGKRVLLSQIFEWYKGDFTQFGSEVVFINKYRKEKLMEKSRISYYTYDWKLNEI